MNWILFVETPGVSHVGSSAAIGLQQGQTETTLFVYYLLFIIILFPERA